MTEVSVPLHPLLPRWEVEGENTWESYSLLEAKQDTLLKRIPLAAHPHQNPPLTTHPNPFASSSSRAAWPPPNKALTHTPGSEGCGDTSSMGLVMVAHVSVGLMPLDGRRAVRIAPSILVLLKEWVSRADCALPTAGKRIKPKSSRAAELEEKQEHTLILQVSHRLIPGLNQSE